MSWYWTILARRCKCIEGSLHIERAMALNPNAPSPPSVHVRQRKFGGGRSGDGAEGGACRMRARWRKACRCFNKGGANNDMCAPVNHQIKNMARGTKTFHRRPPFSSTESIVELVAYGSRHCFANQCQYANVSGPVIRSLLMRKQHATGIAHIRKIRLYPRPNLCKESDERHKDHT